MVFFSKLLATKANSFPSRYKIKVEKSVQTNSCFDLEIFFFVLGKASKFEFMAIKP